MQHPVTHVRNARIELACHALGAAPGRPLLLLHGLHGSAAQWPDDVAWPGPVHALDFSGHGASGWIRGGGYSPELFAGDADAALGVILQDGDEHGVALAGVGLGAYAALLVAGARPDVVRAALLAPGPGMGEGDGEPVFDRTPVRMPDADPDAVPAGCDPALTRYLDHFRPNDYVTAFVERAARLLILDGDTDEFDAGTRSAWWRIASEAPRSERVGPGWDAGLAALAQVE